MKTSMINGSIMIIYLNIVFFLILSFFCSPSFFACPIEDLEFKCEWDLEWTV